jgi:hypothetical protein
LKTLDLIYFVTCTTCPTATVDPLSRSVTRPSPDGKNARHKWNPTALFQKLIQAPVLTGAVCEGCHATRALKLPSKWFNRRERERKERGTCAHLQYDQGDGIRCGAAGILLEDGSSVGVQQRTQLEDHSGLAHTGRGIAEVNGRK